MSADDPDLLTDLDDADRCETCGRSRIHDCGGHGTDLRQRYAEALTKLYAPLGVAKLAYLDEAVDAVLAVRDEELARWKSAYDRAEASERALAAENSRLVQANHRADVAEAKLAAWPIEPEQYHEFVERLSEIMPESYDGDAAMESLVERFVRDTVDRAEAAERKLMAVEREVMVAREIERRLRARFAEIADLVRPDLVRHESAYDLAEDVRAILGDQNGDS